MTNYGGNDYEGDYGGGAYGTTTAATAVFTPAGSPVIWLDAFDVNAGAAQPANLDPVTTWKNKGSLGATGDVTQTEPTFRPTFYTSRINTHPAILFDVASVALNGSTSPVALQAARHIFVVCTVPATIGTALYTPRASVTGAYCVRLGNSSAVIETNNVDTNNALDGAPPATGTHVIYEMSFSGVTTASPVVTINGVAQPVSNGVGTGVGPETGVTGYQVGFNFGEAIGDVLSYAGVQTAPVVTANRTGLATKYGITL